MDNWDIDIDPQESSKETEDIKQKRLQLNKDCFHTFNTDYGKRVLEYFKENTIGTYSWEPGQAENYAIWREGQNVVIREIIARIEQAQKEA